MGEVLLGYGFSFVCFFFFSFLIATYIDLSPRLTIPSPHSLGFTTSSYHLKGDQKLPPVPSLSP